MPLNRKSLSVDKDDAKAVEVSLVLEPIAIIRKGEENAEPKRVGELAYSVCRVMSPAQQKPVAEQPRGKEDRPAPHVYDG